jgi:hypothetical protein
MLIDNKFLYISLPRCGSTAFHYSCILAGLDIENIDSRVDLDNSKIDFSSIDESKIMNFIEHGHTPLIELQKKFGYELPIVAVKRNNYERFYSLYKHVIFELNRIGFSELSYKFSNFNLDDLFFFNSSDIMTKKNRYNCISNYLLHISPELIYNEMYQYIINIIDILLTPLSHWHNHNKNINWFDINEIKKLEEWVSKITNTEFKLRHVNSSSFIETNLKFDDEFIEKYNYVYEYYDSPKSNNSVI